jgi:hypothetical protein
MNSHSNLVLRLCIYNFSIIDHTATVFYFNRIKNNLNRTTFLVHLQQPAGRNVPFSLVSTTRQYETTR